MYFWPVSLSLGDMALCSLHSLTYSKLIESWPKTLGRPPGLFPHPTDDDNLSNLSHPGQVLPVQDEDPHGRPGAEESEDARAPEV